MVSRGVCVRLGLGLLLMVGGLTGASAQTVTEPGNVSSACQVNAAQAQLACGTTATATGQPRATAIGQNAQALDNRSTAIGAFALADDANNVGYVTALGASAEATNTSATAIGAQAEATGPAAIAIGRNTHAYGDETTALGTFAQAGNNGEANASAFGGSSTANAVNATAIGQGSHADFANSAAFGQGVSTTRENQQSFGTSSSNYTMAGINSADSKSLQSGPTYLVTSDGAGNLATTAFSVDELNTELGELGEGVAMAMALGGLQVPAGRSFAISGAVGFFDGSTAAAFAAAAKLADTESMSAVLNGGVGVGFESGVVGGTIGLTLAW